MPKPIDSFRFVSGVTRRMVETWIKNGRAEPHPVDATLQTFVCVQSGVA